MTVTEGVYRIGQRLMKIQVVRKKGVYVIMSVPKIRKIQDKRELGRGEGYRSHEHESEKPVRDECFLLRGVET